MSSPRLCFFHFFLSSRSGHTLSRGVWRSRLGHLHLWKRGDTLKTEYQDPKIRSRPTVPPPPSLFLSLSLGQDIPAMYKDIKIFSPICVCQRTKSLSAAAITQTDGTEANALRFGSRPVVHPTRRPAMPALKGALIPCQGGA